MTLRADDTRAHVLELTPDELTETLGGPGRARDVWRCLQRGIALDGHEGLMPGAIERIRARVDIDLPLVTDSRRAECGTTKLLVDVGSGQHVECVLIPSESRTTLCVSSQVGCARQCVFCMTATMGLLRNLTVREIVAQVVLAIREAQQAELPPVRNIVFMGMGEPLDNLEVVERALSIITDDRALGFASRFVTVSTVGTSPSKIRALEGLPAKLAWSVHGVEQELRKRLVPTTKHTMAELRDAFTDVLESRGESLFVEMALIDGVNDSDEHAAELAEFLRSCPEPVRINLLPLNEGREELAPSSSERVEGFAQLLIEAGYFCTIRRSRGPELRAACGQLAVDAKKKSAWDTRALS